MSGLTEFHASLDRFADQLKDHLDEVVQNVGFEVAENVIVGGDHATGTPKDTGFARVSWQLGLGGLPPAPEHTKGEAGADYNAQAAATLGAMGPALLEAKAGVPVFLVSHCAYIDALENGHSGQAPYGMVDITLASAQDIVNKVARAMGAV